MSEEAASATATGELGFLRRGTRTFRDAVLALFAGGFATFALLYCVQPLLPVFAAEFQVSAATSSLALSLTTGFLAPMLLVAGSLAEAWGRKAVMAASLVASSLLLLAAAVAPGFVSFLLARSLEGVALSGLPSVAMAYFAEEIEPGALGLAVGLLIGGNAVGGLAGRFAAGVLADVASWRVALALIGFIGLACGAALWRWLPPSRHFQPHRLGFGSLARSLLAHLADGGLRWLFVLGFLLMGGFVTLYNYIAFRLLAPPYGLSQSAIGAIFAVYLLGMAASALAGRLADRLGRRRVLWAAVLVMLAGTLLTATADLGLIILGIAIMTLGFFAAHSIASSWVGRRAGTAKAQASSLYLFAYYLGGSLVGSAGGIAWEEFGWIGILALVAGCVLAALLVSLRLSALPPLAANRTIAAA